MSADRLLRAVLVVAAVVAVLVDAPTVVRTALVALAVAAVAQSLATRRSRGLPDALLVTLGGVLALLAVTGLALDLVHVPLRATGWALSLGALGLIALAARPAPAPGADRPWSPSRNACKAGAWGLVSLAVVGVAVSASVRSTAAVDVDPLQLSLGGLRSASATVVISTAAATGPLELRTDAGGTTLSYPVFRLGAGESRTAEVLVPSEGRTVITINNAGQSRPLRTLVLSR